MRFKTLRYWLLLVSLLFSLQSSADVEVNATNFPDEAFRNWVLQNIEGASDGILTDAEIANVTWINCGGSYENRGTISNLKGIEYFTALTSLNCNNNQLTDLDVSKNTKLETLYCYSNELTTLVVSKNTSLTIMDCGFNQLTTLDVSNNTALTSLNCTFNQLTILDVSKNTALNSLTCYNNLLTVLNVSKNTALKSLYCDNNQLTYLDLTKNTNLTNANIYKQKISLKAIDTNSGIAIPLLTDFDIIKVTNLKLDGTSINGSITTINGQKYLVFAQTGTAQSSINGKALTYTYITGNSLNSAFSMDVTITLSYTPSLTTPFTIKLNKATNINYTNVIVSGTFEGGYNQASAYGVIYAKSTNELDVNSTSKKETASTPTSNTFSYTLSFLEEGTTYYYVGYALVEGNYVYSDTLSFTTLSHFPVAEYVDLGLSVKWATWNMGASSDKEVGGYYGWGDNTGQLKSVNYNEYAIGNTSTNITGTNYDLAHVKWGGKWRMPTQAEFEELKECTWTYTSNYEGTGIKGYIISGKPGSGMENNKIFMPRGGAQTYKGTSQYYNVEADFWTSNCESDLKKAYYVTLVTGPNVQLHSSEKNLQVPIRPVYDEATSGGTTPGGDTPTPGGDDPTPGGDDQPQTMKVGIAVDLGLSSGILWSDINVGAQSSEDYGNYYAWGETETKDSYSFDNYVYKVDGATDMNVQESYIEIGTDIKGTAYDVAHVKWGGKWRMPTEKEMRELINNCTWTWKDNGFLITGPNGNTIFLPATGYFNGSSVYSDYTQARYWTSDVNVYKDSYHAWARALSFVKSSGEHFMGSYVRSLGCAIRPIYDSNSGSGSTNYTLSIQSGSGGSVSFNSTTISNTTKSFTVSEGRNATITITPNDNYRLKSLTVNGTNVTSSVSNNQYTISNIQTDITVVTTFEQIPITTYSLSIQSGAGGSVSYDGTTVTNKTQSFTVNEGTSATITITPNSGYQLASLTVNGTNVTSSVTNNQYTINNINANTTVVATFEAISPTTYTFSIRSGGNGTISCNGSTTSSSTVTFSIAEGSTATITVSPNTGYRLSSLTVNGINVTSSVTNNRYTINNITANTNVVATFELMTYNLSVQASGNGTVTYNSYSTKNTTRNYTVSHGTSATLTITPDSGYRLTTLTVNGTNVTSNVSNNRYTISSITANTTVVAIFEEIPSTTYSLSIQSGSGGSISYNGSTITNTTRSFTVNEGTNATITITPNTGYRLASLIVNGMNVTSSVSNNQYTISSITANTTVVATFEEIPPTAYTLSIQASSGGSVSYNGTTISNGSRSFTVEDGTSVTISIFANTGYKLSTLTVNGSNVTSSVSNNQYTIGSVTGNTTIVATFAENLQSFSAEGINYQMTSAANKTLNVSTGNYSGHVIIPATVSHEGETWSVRGAETGAFNNAAITAITWNPEHAISSNAFGSQTNPNMLLYVQSASYAPSNVQNVIANGKAKKIVLSDAASGNDFNCPEAFTAEEISYSHKYSMTTGIGESRGWETIALPFNVKEFTHENSEVLVPFKVYSSSTNGKPFWLYQMTVSGWQEATGIEANKPYIISIPNNDAYDQDYNLSGTVTFSSKNVTVLRTKQEKVSYGDLTFVANFTTQSSSYDILALNVNNELSRYEGYRPEGSAFERELRTVHPFEAYMTTSANNAKRSVPIFEELPTAIQEIPMTGFNGERGLRIYTLAGNLVLFSETLTLQEALKRLPRGVYIINGKKVGIK